MPLAVVLPSSTEEVSAILRYCHDNKIKVVPRGAGTSLSGGALPLEDSIVIGLTRMTRVLSIDQANRVARVEAGITNIAITNAAAVHGFFYAPDPSSQLACTLGGNIATNSGGAHCLKYGVTTNNLLGLRMVMIDGEVHRHRRRLSRCAWLRLPRPDRGLGRPVRRRHRGDGAHAQGRRRAHGRCCSASTPLKPPAPASPASSPPASIPVAIEFMDKPAIQVCENFAGAGYPLDVEALLIVEVAGLARTRSTPCSTASPRSPSAIAPARGARVSQSAEESAAIWKGRKAAFGAIGQISDYYCMDGVIPLSKLSEALDRDRPRSAGATASASPISSMPATAICIR